MNKHGGALSRTLNSNLTAATATTPSGLVNFSQTANDLSAILPPRPTVGKAKFAALRGGCGPTVAAKQPIMQVYNDYSVAQTSTEEPSRHMLSREEDGTMVFDEFGGAIQVDEQT